MIRENIIQRKTICTKTGMIAAKNTTTIRDMTTTRAMATTRDTAMTAIAAAGATTTPKLMAIVATLDGIVATMILTFAGTVIANAIM